MKNSRQEMIMRLVAENRISTQQELCERLRREGFAVTQTTVSRDIKELALIKVRSGDSICYALPSLKKTGISGSLIGGIISESVNGVDFAGNTVVVKCSAGMAQAVCAKLDSIELHNVVGTLAGEDTIFILMCTEKDAERLVKELRGIIE